MTNDLVTALLRGERPAEPPEPLWPDVLAYAGDQGVAPILALAASRAGWSAQFDDAIRPRVIAEAALALARARELRRVIERLHAAGVRPLVIKGAQLEYTLYDVPGTRPRSDSDLLIDDRDRDRVRAFLEELGYQPLAHVTGDVAFTQFHYWRVDESGARHSLDVHWRVVNPKAVGDRMSYAALYRDRIPIPALGPAACGPARTDALQIACLHRSAHHHNSDRLIWLYDIHLLASSLSTEEWSLTLNAATERRLEDFVRAGLDAAAAQFATPIPHAVREALEKAAADRAPEISQFAPGRAEVRLLLSDFRHLSGWSDRIRFVREHLLPSPAYMAHRYRTANRAVLPFLYLHRIVTGARRFF